MSESTKYTLDKVTSEVLGEISIELESGKASAAEQVQAMLKETKGEVAKVLETGDRQAESIKRQIIGSAELEARNRLLRTVEEATSLVFQDALAKISQRGSAQYEKALTKLIEEGLEVIGKGATVACNSGDKRTVSSIVGQLNQKGHADLKVDEKSVEAVGGVIVSSRDGTVRFDNTFEARLERLKPQLRREVAAVFGSVT